MPQKAIVVFVCEHGAAKSIIAAAYFNKVAGDMGLALRAVARGTFPDRELSVKTLAGLAKDGLAPVSVNHERDRDVIVAHINHLVNTL